MLIEAQLPCAPLCGPLCNFQVSGRISIPSHEPRRLPSLKRFGKRDNKVLLAKRGLAIRCSTVKEFTPLTQSPAGNPLARLYVALLPGTQDTQATNPFSARAACTTIYGAHIQTVGRPLVRFLQRYMLAKVDPWHSLCCVSRLLRAS